MKRGVIIGVALLVLIGIVFGVLTLVRHGSSSTTTNNTITVWIPFDQAATFNQISAAYLKANPNVTLNVTYIQAKDAASYEAQVVNAIADGNGPDIWMVRSDWIPKHVDKSAPATAPAKGADPITQAKQVIVGNLVDANTVNGQLYGLPLSADALGILYNQNFYDTYAASATTAAQKAALAITAATWEDLRQQVEGVTKVSGATVMRSGLAIGTASNTFAATDVLDGLLTQQNVSILSTDGKSVAFNLPVVTTTSTKLPATSALTYYTSFATPGSANYSWNSTMGDPLTAFLNQKTGAIIGYYSTLQQILAAKPSFTISVAPMVQVDSTVQNRVDYGTTWSLIVNKHSANTDLDWAYLGTLANKDILNQYAAASGTLSTAASIASSAITTPQLYGSAQAKLMFSSELQTLKTFVKPEWQQVDQIIQDSISLVISSGQSPQTSVDAAASRFKVFASQ